MMLQNSPPAYVQYKWFSVEINGMKHPPSPWEEALIREIHINAFCLKQNELLSRMMFAFCLLCAWLVPWRSSPSKAAKLVSFISDPSLRCSSLDADLIRRNLCQAAFFCFDLTSPVPSCLLALTGCVCVSRCRIDLGVILDKYGNGVERRFSAMYD